MDDPKLYSQYHSMQTNDVNYVIQNYINTMKWKNGDSILDVGSGSGEVTLQVLTPVLPQDFKRLVGLDISPQMVNLAKEQNKNPKIDFIVGDISSVDITNTIDEQFDHIFSFFCLHWIQNQQQTLKNLYNLLKPGGEMLLVFVAKSPILDIYEMMATFPKWSKYFTNIQKYISPYHHCIDPKTVFENMLINEGFEVKVCRVEQRFSTFSKLSEMKNTFLAINPFVKKLPKDVQEFYVEDYMKEVYNSNYFKRMENREIVFSMPHDTFIVLASKP